MNIPQEITRDWLAANPGFVFVFGDNTDRAGHGGAAKLRDVPNTYGFITKIHPNNEWFSFFTPAPYGPVFLYEVKELVKYIEANPHLTFIMSPLGSGLANRHGIWEKIIKPQLPKELAHFGSQIEWLGDW